MVVGGRELIDTLWNVNYFTLHEFFSYAHGINRYIMECKYKGRDAVIKQSDELIDTLWNVNKKKKQKRKTA